MLGNKFIERIENVGTLEESPNESILCQVIPGTLEEPNGWNQ